MSNLLDYIYMDQPPLNWFQDKLGNIFPELLNLKNTPQDSEWHAEGNVEIHTQMVLNQVYELINNTPLNLNKERAVSLILSSVFHDIAKPLSTTRKEINGKVRTVSPKHEENGSSYLSHRLCEVDLPYEVIQNIIRLVGHHHLPKLYVIKDYGKEKYFQLSRLVDIELLYHLEIADMKGRICSDKEEQLEYIELFKLYAEDYGVWRNNDVYKEWKDHINTELKDYDHNIRKMVLESGIRDFERSLIFTPEEAISRAYRSLQDYSHLIIMCGVSGSGKSTWIRNNASGYSLISLDNIRGEINGKKEGQSNFGKVLHLAKDRLKECLRMKDNVVWDATNVRYDFRRMISSIGFDYNAHVTLAVIHKPLSEIIKNNSNRERNVPENIIQKQLNSFQWPFETEVHGIEYIT